MTGKDSAMDEILFVFGPARGGTTFLNKILNDWFSVGTGPEGGFVSRAAKEAEKLGDLSDDDKCRKLAETIARSQTFEIIRKRWPENARFNVTPDDIMERMPERTAASAIYAAFKSIADYRGKKRIGNKDPGFWRELPLLQSLFPNNAKYLFIIRDGRDVALSTRHVTWGGGSVYEVAAGWARMVTAVKTFEPHLRPGSLLTIKYEDLLRFPGDTFQSIGEFLGADNLSSLRKQYEEAAALNDKRDNFDKWRTLMSAADQQVFEAVAGNALIQCGYERKFPQAHLGMLRRVLFEAKRVIRRVRVTVYHSLSRLPKDHKKWQSTRFVALIQPGEFRGKK